MDINKFSERLSHCMQEHHLNGNDLAALSGVTAATISRYLKGLRTPTVDNIILLADALDVSVDYLLGLHNIPDDKILVSLYSVASSDDKRVLWTLLERYGGNYGALTRNSVYTRPCGRNKRIRTFRPHAKKKKRLDSP